MYPDLIVIFFTIHLTGLDAMSQALACDHEMDESQNIGWRKKSEGAKRVIISRKKKI